MSTSPKSLLRRPRSTTRRGRTPSLCAALPEALSSVLLNDPATVIGLCLRPKALSADGRRAALALLEFHAARDAAAASAWVMLQRRGRTIH